MKTKKWATGYLNPKGNELKNNYDIVRAAIKQNYDALQYSSISLYIP